MHGAGNDFIICNNMELQITNLKSSKEAIALEICNRHFGVGADGFICASSSKSADLKMEYFNSDGSLAAMCGNGLRCIAAFAYEHGLVSKTKFTIETLDGIKNIEILEQLDALKIVKVEMGNWTAKIATNVIKIDDMDFIVYSTDFCVPHGLVSLDDYKFSTKSEREEFIIRVGAKIEKSEIFPNGINVNFLQIIKEDHILVDTFERGAGRTLACGSGACASHAIAKVLFHINDICEIEMPGGTITTEISNNNQIIMTGAAVTICAGTTDKF